MDCQHLKDNACVPPPRKIEAMSSCTDRSRLPAVFSRAMIALLCDAADVPVFVREPHRETVLTPFSARRTMNPALAAQLRPVAEGIIFRPTAFDAPIARELGIDAIFAGRDRVPASRSPGALSAQR